VAGPTEQPARLVRPRTNFSFASSHGLGLSRFVSAGAVVGTEFVELSATVRGYGEPARFRPGVVGDPDTGCSLSSPRRADVD
jgi:hypothetical protein